MPATARPMHYFTIVDRIASQEAGKPGTPDIPRERDCRTATNVLIDRIAHNRSISMHLPDAGNPQGEAILHALRALCDYADAHEKMFDAPIGEDQLLGDAWADAISALRTLLNGPTGYLHCGMVNKSINEVLRAAGVEVHHG